MEDWKNNNNNKEKMGEKTNFVGVLLDRGEKKKLIGEVYVFSLWAY